VRLSLQFARPQDLDPAPPDPPGSEELDERLDYTIRWWKRWSSKGALNTPGGPAALRSAVVLKGLTNAPTGAIAAAPTTSLPEAVGGSRNWDYRFSWIRDSTFTVRALGELGFQEEADGFRRFVERSAAGTAGDLQIMYGVGGERRLTEIELDGLEGYRGSRPVRIGNAAAKQVQLDVYGELLELAWEWQNRGHSPDDDYWRFLVELVNAAAVRWRDPAQERDPRIGKRRRREDRLQEQHTSSSYHLSRFHVSIPIDLVNPCRSFGTVRMPRACGSASRARSGNSRASSFTFPAARSMSWCRR